MTNPDLPIKITHEGARGMTKVHGRDKAVNRTDQVFSVFIPKLSGDASFDITLNKNVMAAAAFACEVRALLWDGGGHIVMLSHKSIMTAAVRDSQAAAA